MINYKGLFHDQNTTPKFYEGGAHFKYFDLMKELQKLIKVLSPCRIIKNSTQSTSTIDADRTEKRKLQSKRKINVLSVININELKGELKNSKKFHFQFPDIENKNNNKINNNNKNSNFNTIKISKNNSDYINCSPQKIINKSTNFSKNKILLPKIKSPNVISESNLNRFY